MKKINVILKNTHGGKRDGQGRPALGVVPLRVTLTPTQIETAKRLGNGNQSAGVRAALDMAAKPKK